MGAVLPAPRPGRAEIPLTLYVHLPWCARKCPYCDFNSHAAEKPLPEAEYLGALLTDLEYDLPLVGGRPVKAIFFGGGTPSLFPASFYSALLTGIRERLEVEVDAEITLEANPGTVSEACLAALREAGINRLSIGGQSFDDRLLAAIGRIHDAKAVRSAVLAAQRAGFTEVNLDLMFGLPDQSPQQALKELREAIELAPTHISYYQLTLEPGTPFGRQPPPGIADEGALWEMQLAGSETLESSGYRRYEISAYSQSGSECRHNRNYWEFGDYLGLGAGAHGKLTSSSGTYFRSRKLANPAGYLRTAGTKRCGSRREIRSPTDRMVEFLINALRLTDGFATGVFESRTGLPARALLEVIQPVLADGFLITAGDRIMPTQLGMRYLDEVLSRCAIEADH
ncbi:MAG: radical SAM family heme chaperone HemW [Gammaproteobacteria bacterium]